MCSFRRPDMVGLMDELSTYQKAFQPKPRKIDIIHNRPALLVQMLDSMPADGFLCLVHTMYFWFWDTTMRVLHKTAFHCEMEQALEIRRSRPVGTPLSFPSQFRESVIPQMVAVVCLTSRLDIKTHISENQITQWVDMIQTWLDMLKGKERLNIHALRTQTLLLLVRINNMTISSDLWKMSGLLVRSAMVVGLHQDVEGSREISLFDREQRRKLWRTIVELDLQCSLATGMPTAIRSSDFDSQVPSNINDTELISDMTVYTKGQDIATEWTDALPQIALSSSIKARLDVANLLAGNLNMERDSDTLLKAAKDIELSLSTLPTAIKLDNPKYDRDPGKLFTKIMIDVYLRRFTLSIYRAIVLSLCTNNHPFARKAVVESSIATLSHLDALDPDVADPNTIKTRHFLDLFHVLCKHDLIQACQILCFEIQTFSLSSRSPLTESAGHVVTPDLPRRIKSLSELGFEASWTKHSLTRIVENTLKGFFQRFGMFGCDLKDILPLSIVLQASRAEGSTEDKVGLMEYGAQKVLTACRDALPRLPEDMSAQIRAQNNNVVSLEIQFHNSG
jgi:hypothetical protein